MTMDTAYCTPTVALDLAENVSEAVEEEEDDERERGGSSRSTTDSK